MGLADVASAVMTPVVTALPALTWELSTRAQPKHASPPRVLWIPQGGSYGPARKDASNPRRLYTWRQSVRVEIWGETIAQVEGVHALVVRELHHVACAVMKLGAGRWVDTEGATTMGELYTFTVDLDFALTEATEASVVLTAATTDDTGATAGDGVLESGEQ